MLSLSLLRKKAAVTAAGELLTTAKRKGLESSALQMQHYHTYFQIEMFKKGLYVLCRDIFFI